MGDPKAFLKISRKEAGYRKIHDRIHDFGEVEQTLNSKDRQEQASRCMDCGVPFCHWACPLGNKIPEWNEALSTGNWERAYQILSKTNDFPEFTGRICPALCEKSCVLQLSEGSPTTIRENECDIAERAFLESYIKPIHPKRNGKKVAIIGAGPAGLAAANQLNHKGYEVVVFEKQEAAGGLLRYGIPNFKLSKNVIDRRINLMEEEGVTFKYNQIIDFHKLPEGFDAYLLSIGTPTPRDLKAQGRELKGIYYALDMLSQQNKVLAGDNLKPEELVTAKGKDVLVIGGGDTGSDCIGTSIRQGSKSVTQIEIMPKPPIGENQQTPWPYYPRILKTTSSHEEGCTRRWLLNTNKFIGENGKLIGVEVEGVIWDKNPKGGRPIMKLNGKKEIIKCDIVLLAMGFLRPELPKCAGNVFFAGDIATGPTLVVKAIAEGREASKNIIEYLAKK